MDVSQYLEIFIDETKEHLQSLNDQLLILETEPENVETINEIFRAAHSLKGMAGTMGYKRMQRLTHDMENVFSEIRNGNMKVTADLVDVLFKGLDALEAYLSNIQQSADEGTEDYEDVINQLNDILNVGLGKGKGQAEPAKKDVPVVTSTAAPQSDSGFEKFRDLVIQSYERNAIQKAYDIGMNVFGITVYIQETCILKAARAFLVFKTLEDLGEVIKSEPDVQDIEDEKFDLDFSLILLTKESLESIKKDILNISEIQNVYIDNFKLDQAKSDTAETEEENNKQEKSSAKDTGKNKVSGTSVKQTSKPFCPG